MLSAFLPHSLLLSPIFRSWVRLELVFLITILPDSLSFTSIIAIIIVNFIIIYLTVSYMINNLYGRTMFSVQFHNYRDGTEDLYFP
jgi:hypothetical protein